MVISIILQYRSTTITRQLNHLRNHIVNTSNYKKFSTTSLSYRTISKSNSKTRLHTIFKQQNKTALAKYLQNQVHQRNHFRLIHSSSSFSAKTSEDKDPSLEWMRTGKKYNQGPDQILPSKAYYTCHRRGAVNINIEPEKELANRKPISVPSLLKLTAQKHPDQIALMVKRDSRWQKWSYKEYLHDVRTCAKGFISLGLEPYHSVCILGFNSPEWFISDLGAIFAGGLAAGIYTSNSAEACAYPAIDSGANIYVVEDTIQLQKILEIRDTLPNLKAIVQYTGDTGGAPGVYSWKEMMQRGEEMEDEVLELRLRNISVNQCCTLIYTSGTTGLPKGVMLSHDNLTWMGKVCKKWIGFREPDDDFQEVSISFLPLSHVAAQMSDIYCPLNAAGMVVFTDKMALKGTLVEHMKENPPTKFLAVPQVWEKMHEKMSAIGRGTTGIKKTIANWAKKEGLEHNLNKMNHGFDIKEPIGFKFADKLVLSRIKEALGLTRCELNLSGAAPISQDILKYFLSLNVIVTEAYGLSESSGPHTMALADDYKIGSVGKTMYGCRTKILKPNAKGIGEVLMKGRHIAMGYLHQEEKTKAAIDPEGWFHTEDIGYIDSEGFLFIVGRLKELLITRGGKNIAPVPIEENVKAELPEFVNHCMLLGDKQKYLSMLITIKSEVDPNTQEPLNKLIPCSKKWVEEVGNCKVETVEDVIRELKQKKNEKLKKAIDDGIIRANQRSSSHAEWVQKWEILPVDFSIPGGEIGPTLKLKRSVVYEKYKDLIEKIYNPK